MQIVEQEEKKGVTGGRRLRKLYKVTSSGENGSSFCLKVVGADNSFVTRNLPSHHLPSVVE